MTDTPTHLEPLLDPVYRAEVALRLLLNIKPTASECWEWQKLKDAKGYGRISIKREMVPCHRVAYFIFMEPWEGDLQIDHLCRNTSCCNPRHLEPVTAAENLRRVPKILKTHCPQGHPYAFLNATSQRRVCVECNRKAAREYQQRKRDARV